MGRWLADRLGGRGKKRCEGEGLFMVVVEMVVFHVMITGEMSG